MRAQAPAEEVDAVCATVEERGFRLVKLPGEDRIAIGVLASNPLSLRAAIISMPGVGHAVMAGPCSVESEAQLMESAEAVAKAGGHILRGGAFKPRTSPYSFRGLGEEGLK